MTREELIEKLTDGTILEPKTTEIFIVSDFEKRNPGEVVGIIYNPEEIMRSPTVCPYCGRKFESTGWIPVTERLPEVGDTYIVTIEYKGRFEGVDAADFVFTGDGYIDGRWNTWNDWVEDKSEFYHVTAWMPLPDPPGEVME